MGVADLVGVCPFDFPDRSQLGVLKKKSQKNYTLFLSNRPLYFSALVELALQRTSAQMPEFLAMVILGYLYPKVSGVQQHLLHLFRAVVDPLA